MMSGNVGIGTLTAPNTLEVNGAIGATGNVLTSAFGSTTGAPRLFGFSPSFAAGQAAQVQFGDVSNVAQNGYGDRMQLSAYWGIEIRGNAETNAPAFVGGVAADPSLTVFGASAASAPNSNILELVNSTGATVYDVFNNTGNIGIGSLTPGQKLDIQGTARMTGFTLNLNPNAGYVMVGNSVGIGTWMPATTLPSSGGRCV